MNSLVRIRKIYIVGIVASGKTTFARRLSAHTGITWHELDNIVYSQTAEERHKRTFEEQREIIDQVDREGSWIFEGTDRSSYSYLYEMADTVIVLDPPLWTRRMRIISRWIKQNLGLEPVHYRPDISILKMMFRWTNDFERQRPQFEQKIASHGDKVLWISNVKEVELLLAGIGKQKNM